MFGLLSGLGVKLALLAGLFLAGTISGGWAVHKLDAAHYLSLEMSYVKAQEAAAEAARTEQARLDGIATGAARQEAAAQAARASLAQRQLKDLQLHVKARSGDCFRYDFIRLLDSRVYGVLTERLPQPTGKSPSACTGFDAPTLAGAIGGIIDQYRAVAEQHNALIAFYRKAKQP